MWVLVKAKRRRIDEFCASIYCALAILTSMASRGFLKGPQKMPFNTAPSKHEHQQLRCKDFLRRYG